MPQKGLNKDIYRNPLKALEKDSESCWLFIVWLYFPIVADEFPCSAVTVQRKRKGKWPLIVGK